MRQILHLLFALSVFLCQAQKKNVLFIMVDDWNHWISPIGYYDQAITPNVNELAGRGVLFADASSPSPVCNPSRNAILSGVYPAISGISANSTDPVNGGYIRDRVGFENVLTLNQHFKESGYYTYAGGKIYHPGSMGAYDTDPNNWTDFTTQSSGSQGGDDYAWVSDVDDLLEWGAGEFDIETSGDRLLARDIAEKISSYDSDEPFFMALGLFRPHLPWRAHKRFFDMYNPDTLDIPKGYLENDNEDILASYNGQDYFQEVVDEGQWKNAIRAYLANMTYADENVGIVMDALNNSEYADNTIVVFMGDHGWHLGEKDRLSKHAVFDQASRTTFIIYDPSARENGKICKKTVNLLDAYPTLVELCGLDKVETAQGNDLTPLLSNVRRYDWDKPTLITYSGTNIIKTSTWRFVDEGDQSQLYNIRKDPYEWTNLYGNPRYDRVVSYLRGEIDDIILDNEVVKLSAIPIEACNQILLEWSDLSEEKYYEVQRKDITAGDSKFTTIAKLDAGTISFLDSTVNVNNTYEYTVTAVLSKLPDYIFNFLYRYKYKSKYLSKYLDNRVSNVASATSLDCVDGEIVIPDITDLSSNSVACNTVDLTWSDVIGEEGYQISRIDITANETEYTSVAVVPENIISFSDTTATLSNQYGYIVEALRNDTTVNTSNQSVVNTVDCLDGEVVIPNIEDLVLSSNSCDEVVLNWSDVAGEDEYRIRRINITAGETGFVNIADVPANSTSYVDSNVDENSEYQYMVRALINNTSMNVSNTPTFKVASCTMQDITNLTAISTACNEAELLWSDVTGEDEYYIGRLNVTAGETDFVTVTMAPANSSSFIDTTVALNTQYQYMVRAMIEGEFANTSNVADVTTVNCVDGIIDIPDIVDLALTESCDTVMLTWSDVAGEDEYRIRRINLTAGETDFTNIADVPANTTSFIDADVEEGTEYEYMVRALINNASQNISNREIITTSLCDGDGGEEMENITDLAATADTCNAVVLTWSDEFGEDEYRIRRINLTAGETTADYTNLADVPANTTSFTDTDVDPETEYQYVVRGVVDNVAITTSTPPAVVMTPACDDDGGEEMENITDLAATADMCNAVVLTWSDEFGEDEYRIRRINLTAGETTADYTNLADVPANTTSFTDTDVDPETEYQYVVRGVVDNVAITTSTPPAVVMTPACDDDGGEEMENITDLAATADTCNAVVLTWSDEFGEDEYRIRRINLTAGETTADYTNLADVPANTTSFTDTDVDPETEYQYVVRGVVDNVAITTSTPPAVVMTPACESDNVISDISDLILTSTCDGVALNWSDVNGEDEYRIRRIDLTAGETDYTNLGDVSANTTSFVDSTASYDTEYQYMVRALVENTAVNLSNTPIITTIYCEDGVIVIPDIDDLALSSTCNTVTLTWSDVNGEDEYRIRRINLTAGETSYTNITDVSANSTSFIDTGVEENTEYQYMVRALISNSSMNLSNTPTISTTSCDATTRQAAEQNEVTVSGDELNFDIQIYPNPVMNTLYLKGLENIENATIIEIIDLEGSVIGTYNNVDKIDVTDLSYGVYLLRVNELSIRFMKN